jgi:hypothetical protein
MSFLLLFLKNKCLNNVIPQPVISSCQSSLALARKAGKFSLYVKEKSDIFPRVLSMDLAIDYIVEVVRNGIRCEQG